LTNLEPSRDKRSEIGLDTLIEDVFGLSWKGLGTIGHLVGRPRAVFMAARDADWLGRYTPTIRLVFSMIALLLLLQFFWVGEVSPQYQQILAQYEVRVAADPTLPDPRTMTDQFIAYWTLIMPFSYFSAHLAGAWLIRVWGKGTGMALRVRFYFALLVPGLILVILTSIALPLISLDSFLLYGVVTILVAGGVYGATYYRGMRGDYSGWALWWRAFFAGGFLLFLDLVSSVLTGTFADLAYNTLGPMGILLDT